MKNKKLTFLAIGIIIIMIVFITINVQASNGFKASIESSKNELEEEEEVVVTLKLEKYQEIKNGINAYKATLDYDENIFEEVIEQNFTCKNNWELLKYNKDTREFVAIKKVGSKETEEVASVILKVKEEIEPKTTEVKIKEIVTSDGKKDIDIEDAKVGIDIIKEQEEKPEDPKKPEKITSNKYEISEGYILGIAPRTTVAEFRQNVVLENVTTNPQMVFTDKNGNILQEDSLIKTGTQLKVGSSLHFNLVVVGDIDSDSEITINDLANIKLHLIETKLLTGLELKAADVDGDSEITINDLAQMKLILIGSLKLK